MAFSISKTLFTVIAAGVLLWLAQPAAAQSGGDRGLDPDGVPYSSKYWQGMPQKNAISLVRLPGLNDDQFVLRITDAFTMSGCARISDLGYAAEYKGPNLNVEIAGATVDMRGQPQYAHYQCDVSSKRPTADIVLSRQDIAANQTRYLRLLNGTDANYFHVKLDENRMMLVPDAVNATLPQRFKAQNPPGRKAALVFWFYPVGTVLLWANTAGIQADGMEERLRAFAAEKGLTPLESLMPDFKSPLADKRYLYYVDTAGALSGDAPTLASGGAQVGTMSVDRLVYGLEKDEYEPYDIKVYARTPGMYD